MKKLARFLAGLMIFPAMAAAQSSTYNQSSNQVSLSSSVATEMTGNLNLQRAFVWSVKVTNLDATNNVCCSQDPSVTCTLGAHHGDVIASSASAPYNYLSWIINTTQAWYCRTASVSAATNVQVGLTSGIQ